MDLKLGMLVHIITQHVHVYKFKSQSHCNCENILDFVIFYNKNDQKLSAFWSVKYTYYN